MIMASPRSIRGWGDSRRWPVAVFAHLLSGLTLSCGSHRVSHQQHWPGADWLCESLSNRGDRKSPCAVWGSSASSNRSPGQCFINSTCPVPGQGGNAPLEWAGISESWSPGGGKKEDLRTRRSRKPLDMNLLASCVCQTTAVIYPRITS